ncbi:hypothetical protein D6D05_00477 [Aureobasidium pullulans]|nr:hypothetical protein D6D05_00477 [Aureobasidium pullulans]
MPSQRQAIHASSAPKPNGNYSHVHRAILNIKACLLAANSSLDKIVRRRIYLMKMSDFRKVDEIWAEYFEEPYPVSTCVQVSGLAKEGALVELEVVAQA